MFYRRLLTAGLIGTGVAALCCFTPVLVILLGTIGLSGWLAWLDYLLLPALVLCVGLAGFAWLRLRRPTTKSDPSVRTED